MVFEQGAVRDKRITSQDLEIVINSSSFYRDGDAYFMGIWRQAERSKPEHQSRVLCCLCDRPLSISEISDKTKLSVSSLQSILSALQKCGILVNTNGRYTYAVELMRGWLKRLYPQPFTSER